MSYEFMPLKARPNVIANLQTGESIAHIPAKDVTALLSEIEVGDLLQGECIIENNQPLLKLEGGLKLLIHLPIDLLPSKKLDFKVVGKEGQRLLLEYIDNATKGKQATNIVNQTLEKLNLKETPEMKQIIQQFVEKQLPLLKEQMTQLVYFSKKYAVPTQVLTNLTSQNQLPKEDELDLLSCIKEKGIEALLPKKDIFIEGLEPTQGRVLAKSLLTLMNTNEIEQVLRKIDSEGYEKRIQLELFKNLESIDDKDPAQGIQNLSDQLLKMIPDVEIKKINKMIIEAYLTVHMKKISKQDNDEREKITELSIRLKQIVTSMKEVMPEKDEIGYFDRVEKNIDILDKYKMQGHYFYFPLQVKEHQISGELYFFKPKKHVKGKQSGIHIVLALNMPNLHKVEVHLLEQSQEVLLKIKVENETIKKYLEQYIPTLLETMHTSPILIKKVEIERLDEYKTIESLVDGLYSLDLKV